MAFRKMIPLRLVGMSRTTNSALTNCRTSSPRTAVKSAAALNHQTARNKLAHDPGDDCIFRRYLHRQSEATPTALRFLPTGEKLLEKLREMDTSRDRINLDGLRPAAAPEGSPEKKLTVADAKKILKLSQLEMVKLKLRRIEKDFVSYPEFLEVVKAIQGLLPVSPSPADDDPRTKELQELERQKAAIDKIAESNVRRELWFGLGYLVVQTAAFMRLTFWELTWDVMEPICFYVTSMYFMGGYAFFLRTSKEPSFEGFFQSRFSAKQKKLMKAWNFDVERYNELKKACCAQSRVPQASPVVAFMSRVHSD